MKDIFITLFFLGASLDLYVANPRIVEISKHSKNNVRKIKDRERIRTVYLAE